MSDFKRRKKVFSLLNKLLTHSSLFFYSIRRKFNRGLKRKPMALVKKLRKKKKEAPANEKPDVVKTHLRDMIIVPEMTGSIVGVYNGKTFNQVEIKVGKELLGYHWLDSCAELWKVSSTYKLVQVIRRNAILVK